MKTAAAPLLDASIFQGLSCCSRPMASVLDTLHIILTRKRLQIQGGCARGGCARGEQEQQAWVFCFAAKCPRARPDAQGKFPTLPFRNKLSTTAHAHSSMQKPSNSGQNRSKRRRFPSKSDQKGAHFVMPILTFRGVTPSGASARAVFTFRKGKKARFGGAKWRLEKLSTIWTAALNRARGSCAAGRETRRAKG